MLYAACVPFPNDTTKLFVKVGYRCLGEGEEELIIGYLEGKSQHFKGLSARECHDAFIYMFRLPNKFKAAALASTVLDRPELSAEQALKRRFFGSALNNSKLLAVPCDRNGNPAPDENTEFFKVSASSQFSLDGIQRFDASLSCSNAYEALTEDLRDFSEEPALMPCRPVVNRGHRAVAGRADKKILLWIWEGMPEPDFIAALHIPSSNCFAHRCERRRSGYYVGDGCRMVRPNYKESVRDGCKVCGSQLKCSRC